MALFSDKVVDKVLMGREGSAAEKLPAEILAPDVQRLSPGVLAIRAEPEIIDALLYALENLLALSKRLKHQATIIRAEQRAQDPERRQEQERRFNARSRNVYKLFVSLQELGATRADAIKSIARDRGYQYYETELYISQGRRLERESRDRDIRDRAAGGQDLATIAAVHGLTPRTIQKILDKQ